MEENTGINKKWYRFQTNSYIIANNIKILLIKVSKYINIKIHFFEIFKIDFFIANNN